MRMIVTISSASASISEDKINERMAIEVLSLLMSANFITKATAEIRYTEDGGYSEISASLYPKGATNE